MDLDSNIAGRIFRIGKPTHPRLCNAVAHFLAKLALKKRESVVWLDEFSAELLYLFAKLNQ